MRDSRGLRRRVAVLDHPRREVQDRGRTADVPSAHEQFVPSRGISGSGTAWTQVKRTNALGEFDIDGFADPACAQPACYLDLLPADIGQIDPGRGKDDTEEIMGRLGFGVSLWDIGAFNTWGPSYGGLDTISSGRSPTSRVPS